MSKAGKERKPRCMLCLSQPQPGWEPCSELWGGCGSAQGPGAVAGMQTPVSAPAAPLGCREHRGVRQQVSRKSQLIPTLCQAEGTPGIVSVGPWAGRKQFQSPLYGSQKLGQCSDILKGFPQAVSDSILHCIDHTGFQANPPPQAPLRNSMFIPTASLAPCSAFWGSSKLWQVCAKLGFHHTRNAYWASLKVSLLGFQSSLTITRFIQ